MSDFLFAATAHGLFRFERDGETWRESGGAMLGHHFTSVMAREGSILAGTTDGIYRSDDMGQTWWEASEGLAERHIRSLAYHPSDSDLVFAGTEPAAIFISHDGAETWGQAGGVADLRDRYGWYLPYSPAAGAVRGFAFHGDRGYAAVEQGGLLRSDDQGELWALAEGSTGEPDAEVPESAIHPDVHSVRVHPSSPDQVFAATGGGLYETTDGGRRWMLLYACYCRSIWVDPSDPGHLVLGPADGVDRNGRIERSINGGDTWRPIMSGLDSMWPRHMVDQFAQAGDELLAVLSNGGLIGATLGDWEWRPILPAVQDVTGVVATAW